MHHSPHCRLDASVQTYLPRQCSGSATEPLLTRRLAGLGAVQVQSGGRCPRIVASNTRIGAPADLNASDPDVAAASRPAGTMNMQAVRGTYMAIEFLRAACISLKDLVLHIPSVMIKDDHAGARQVADTRAQSLHWCY